MSERVNIVIRRQPVKGSREEIVLSAAKAFYDKQFPQKAALRLIEIFEPLVVIANGGNDQEICQAVAIAETNIKDYFQQLKNQLPGYVFATPSSAQDSVEPKPIPGNPVLNDTDDQPEQVLEPEFD
ncbi:hypothetical protein [Acaryochloris marina]|uniref:hypothetical protein n=1 Tax=Acaryochloris marina TaxID=155978 RepID=UPI0021C3DF5F|nr:hypothetical protein [Acaryochloris marina]BDM83588.1 hypothetical protein AM10699_64490 [Acaryochloris marina MBIC10699]